MGRRARMALVTGVLGGGAALTYTISGTVYDADGTTPVPGATVALGAYTADSAANGTFTISDIPADTSGSMTCTLAGYVWTAISIAAMSGNLTGQNYTNVWYAWGGISANVIAAYVPVGAASLDASYNRVAGSGGNADLDPAVVGSGVAPTNFDPLHGWLFDGVNDLLFSGVVPTAAFSVVASLMEVGIFGNMAAFGVNDGASHVIQLNPQYTSAELGAAGDVSGYWGGATLNQQAPAKWRKHIFAYSTDGNVLYVDGSAFKTMTGGTMPGTYGITLGGSNTTGTGVRFLRHWQQAWVAYNIALDATQAAAITAALSAHLALSTLRTGAWSFFGHPHAVHFASTNDKTYIAGVGASGNATIQEYNHATNAMSVSTLLQNCLPNLTLDDHNQPAILVRDSDKKLIVWYSKHNGATIYQHISTNAEDASAWGAAASLDASLGGASYSYPTPVQLTDETNDPIYLFFRDTPSTYYSVSADGGATWAARQILIQHATGSPYWQVAQNGNGRIDFVFSDSHPNNVETNSIYHFYYSGGNYYKTDGTLISTGTASLPITNATATKVYDGATTSAWCWDIAITAGGLPVIVFATFPGDTFPTSAPDHRYNYAIWDGDSWNITEIAAGGGSLYAAEPYYSGGVTLDHDDINTVYCSRYVSGQWEIFKYVTADAGASWAPTQITTGSTVPQIRPIVPRGSSSELKVVWMSGRYTTFTDYFTYLKSDPQYT